MSTTWSSQMTELQNALMRAGVPAPDSFTVGVFTWYLGDPEYRTGSLSVTDKLSSKLLTEATGVKRRWLGFTIKCDSVLDKFEWNTRGALSLQIARVEQLIKMLGVDVLTLATDAV